MKRLLALLISLLLVTPTWGAYPTTTSHARLYPWTSIMAAPYSCDPTGVATCVAAINQLKADLSNSGTIHVPKGTFLIATDLTIPAGMQLRVEAGGLLSVSAGKTLTINGTVDAGPYQIVTGAGTVSWGSVQSHRYAVWTSAAGSVLPQVQASPTVDGELARKKYVDDQIAGGAGASPSGVQNSTYTYAADAGATDDYAITLAPAIAAYATGQEFNFIANTANTDAATLNVNAKGAKDIKKYVAGALVALATGDIVASQHCKVRYDGTRFILLFPSSGSSGSGYTLSINSTSGVVDATTYYFGSMSHLGYSTSAAVRRLYIPRSGTITRVHLYLYLPGALGTAELSTLYLGLNNTTNTIISTTVICNAASVLISNTALSISVVVGDYVEFKWITPTWVTNPSTVNFSGTIFVE